MKSAVSPIQLAAVVLVAALLNIHPAWAADGDWTLVESSGSVHVTLKGIRPVALTTGDEVGPGQRIVTDADGRAVLQRGKSTIVMSPNSALEVPAGKSNELMTRIRQLVGTLLFNVEKRKEQHFEVLTPNVAVVVKGTTFTTTVGAQGAVVHVVEGLVQVTDIQSGRTVFVRPGQTAVSPKGGGSLNVRGASTDTPTKGPAAQASDTGKQAAAEGKANGSGHGQKIGQQISGRTQTLAQLSGGLLHRDGVPNEAAGHGNGVKAGFTPLGADGAATQNPGGNVPQGIAVGVTGATPPGLVGNTNAHGGNPNAGGANSHAGGNGNGHGHN